MGATLSGGSVENVTTLTKLAEFGLPAETLARVQGFHRDPRSAHLWIHDDAAFLSGLARTSIGVSLCESVDDQPCGTCAGCSRLLAGTTTECFWGELSTIDEVRGLHSWIHLRNMSSRPRWLVLEHAHQLNVSAQNALLKTLEELPKNTVALLLTAQPMKLLSTVRSRLIYWRFPRHKITEVPSEELVWAEQFLNWFTLARPELAEKVQHLLADPQFKEGLSHALPAWAGVSRDLWYVSRGSDASHLRFTGLYDRYRESVARSPNRTWERDFERWETLLMRRERSFQEPLAVESELYGLFLGS